MILFTLSSSSLCLQAKRSPVERGGLAEAEPLAAAESHEQGRCVCVCVFVPLTESHVHVQTLTGGTHPVIAVVCRVFSVH